VELRKLAVTQDSAEDVVEVVRDATGKPPDRFQFSRLLQPPLHLFTPRAPALVALPPRACAG